VRAFVERISKKYLRVGFRRGLTEGSDLWLAVGALALLVRVVTKQDKPAKVTERLKLGESITVTHIAADPTRRAAKRAARRAPSAPAGP
jgi:hypothetical protein